MSSIASRCSIKQDAEDLAVGRIGVGLHREAEAGGRVERAEAALAGRRIAHRAHRLLGIGGAPDHREDDPHRAGIEHRLDQPVHVPRHAHDRRAAGAVGRGDHRMGRLDPDRPVLHVEEQPVEARRREHLGRMHARHRHQKPDRRPAGGETRLQGVDRSVGRWRAHVVPLADVLNRARRSCGRRRGCRRAARGAPCRCPSRRPRPRRPACRSRCSSPAGRSG